MSEYLSISLYARLHGLVSAQVRAAVLEGRVPGVIRVRTKERTHLRNAVMFAIPVDAVVPEVPNE